MKTKVYEFADIAVQADYQSEYLSEMCRDYETDKEPCMKIVVTNADVAAEEEKSEVKNLPYGYLESLAFYRKFCEQAVYEEVLLFHSSAVAVDDEAYLFTAPSGTGKSTHTALWREVWGERAVMINDDKPLLRFREDGVWVYGTPWDGKHRLSTNKKARIKAVCILERGEKNIVKREAFADAYPFILRQTYCPDNENGMAKTLELVNRLMEEVPVFRMKCNISKEAVHMAYEAMHA